MYTEGLGEPRFPDKGRLRESNPRPLVPKTRIIPLDQSDNSTFRKSGAKKHFWEKCYKILNKSPKSVFCATFLKSGRKGPTEIRTQVTGVKTLCDNQLHY